jgi:hypothetical protein
MPKKKYSVPRAKAKAPDAHAKTGDLIAFQQALRVSVPQSPHFNADPSIGTTFAKWTSVTDQLALLEQQLVQLLGQVEPIRIAIGSQRAQYMTAAETFISTVQTAMLDDGPGIQSFGLHLKRAPGPTPVPTAPVKLRMHSVKGQPGHYVVRWHLVPGAGLYELQRSTDGTTFETVYTGKSAEFTDSATVGQTLWFQVRAHGDTLSAWSSPIKVIVF